MMAGRLTEQLAERIASMERDDCMRLLKEIDCSFKLDFSDAFLQEVSLERLRHITLAASLHVRNAGNSLRQTGT